MSDFVWTARVYWEDTDGGGIVYYANYLKFLERARTEWLRLRGHVQTELAVDPGILFTVTEVNIRYRRPARLDDLLVISCEPQRDGAATMLFRQEVHRGAVEGELLAEATTRVACVGAANLRPRRLPPAIVREFE